MTANILADGSHYYFRTIVLFFFRQYYVGYYEAGSSFCFGAVENRTEIRNIVEGYCF